MSTPPTTAGPRDLVALLERRAERDGERPLFTFWPDGLTPAGALSAAGLAARARAVGAWLAARGLTGERVVVLLPPGTGFLEAFFGCVYAGAVCAPGPMPDPDRLARTLPRVRSMIDDARPAAVLTDREGLALAPLLREGGRADAPAWLALEDAPTEAPPGFSPRAPRPDDAAHLQYTSGSTSAPKGTIITHASLMANSAAIQAGWRTHRDSRSVVWVPHFHDDGLVQGLIQPLYVGFTCALLPAAAFIARPERWLGLISRTRATHSGGPNFAYALAARKVGDEALDGLDLSCWEMAYNAAEPIRAETLRAFFERFAPVGLRWSALAPCFGLAEATLLVSTSRRAEGPLVLHVDGRALEREGRVRPVEPGAAEARALVGCGEAALDTTLTIVDPDTLAPRPEGHVGEVLVAGPSLAAGYLDRPEDSARTFVAGGPGGERALRTGDQGFLWGGELFITGRIKDLLIVRGENRYPQDIEWTVERAHAAVSPGAVAAFALEREGEERLGIAAEIREDPDAPGDPDARRAAIAEAILDAVAAEHELGVHALVLLPRGRLPKTSSGKIQRRAVARALAEGRLEPLRLHEAAAPEGPREAGGALLGVVLAALAAELGRPAGQLSPEARFSHLGLDSALTVRVAAALEDALGRPVPATLLWNHPSPAELARALAGGAAPARREAPTPTDEPLALIGAACRFPGGEDLDAWWASLRDGVDAVGPASDERLRGERAAAAQAGHLRAIDGFDPEFFELTARDAAAMDPQQRLLLEVAWEALEAAGLTPEALRGSPTGVFVGISSNEYQQLALARRGTLDPPGFLGTAHSTGTARLSYWLGLRGPNLPVDTACSSSLVALHLACRALRAGDCEVAVVGGVNLLIDPEVTRCLDAMGALSPSGRCRTFSDDADGYVRAEGCGVVVLKPLAAARRDGDPVLALLRGSAVNQDGATHGLTAPSGPAQRAVIEAALAEAGVAPAEVDLVEAHGTGTPLGDPIEVGALAEVFAGPRAAPLALGAVKSAVGHLEAAAGMAGLLKVVQALRHEAIPPNLHLRAPNPRLALPADRLALPTALQPWPRGERPRRAGVSSFGMSGTNAHVLIEEAPPAPETPEGEGPWLVPLSATSEEALRGWAGALAQAVDRGGTRLDDLAFTLSRRRAHRAERAAVVAGGRQELVEALWSLSKGEPHAALSTGRAAAPPAVAFVFSGQGTQGEGMAASLLEASAVFRRRVEAFDAELRRWGGASVIDALRGAPGAARLSQTRAAQPALVAVGLGLAALLEAEGVRPVALIGHSVGEITAACLSGALTLSEAARLVTLRGELLQETAGTGRMVAVGVDEATARRALGRWSARVGVAAVNGPSRVVLAGDTEALGEVLAALPGARTRDLGVDHPFHGPSLDGVREALVEALGWLTPARTDGRLFSTVTGMQVRDERLDAAWWGANLRNTVRFADAVRAARREGATLFLELGPHPALTGAIAELLDREGGEALGTLRRGSPDLLRLRACLAALYVRGAPLRFDALDAVGRATWLPPTPWRRRRLWLAEGPAAPRPTGGHPLLGPAGASSLDEGATLFQRPLDPAHPAWLSDHRVQGRVVVPGAALAEAALAAGARHLGHGAVRLDALDLRSLLELPGEAPRTLELVVRGEGEAGVRVLSRGPGERRWRLHAEGRVRATHHPPPEPLAVGPAPAGAEEDARRLRARLAEAGLALGPGFSGLREVWTTAAGDARGTVTLPPGLDDPGHLIHPALLDACLHVVGALPSAPRGLPLPVGFEGLTWAGPPPRRLQVVARPAPDDPGVTRPGLTFSDPEGGGVGAIEALRLRWLPPADEALLHRLSMEPLPWPEGSPPSGRWLLVGEGPLASALAEALAGPDREVVRAGMDAPPPPGPLAGLLWLGEPAAADAAPDAPARALLRWAKALLERPTARLWAITRGALAVGGEAPRMDQGALTGLLRCLALEHPDAGVTCLDLPAASGAEVAPRVVAALAAPASEDLLALRGEALLGGRLRPLLGPSGDGFVPRGDGACVLTGGTGALGLALAEALAGRGARHLHLLGRRPPNAAARRRAQALEAQGARVRFHAVDVADRAALREVLDGIRAEGLPIRGVVHAAGVLEDGAARALQPEVLARVMAPKALGGRWLDELTATDPLHLFLLISSAAARIGSPGQAAYAAANAALDALAAARAASGRPGVSVQLGPIAGQGLAADPARIERLARLGAGPLTMDEAVAATLGAAGGPEPVVTALRLDRAAWRASFAAAARSALLGSAEPEADAAERREAPDPERAAQVVLDEVARALGARPEGLDLSATLLSLGLDSILALELRERLARRLGVELPVTELVSAPTLGALAEAVVARLGAPPPERVLTLPTAPPSSDGLAPASPGQERLWTLHQLAPTSGLYTLAMAMDVEGALDEAALAAALADLHARHAALRTTFVLRGGRLFQRISPAAPPSIVREDLRGLPEPEQRARLEAAAALPFDLTEGPLSRVVVFAQAEGRWTLLWCLHHAISDAWSLTVLLGELAACYTARLRGAEATLEPLPRSYVDFAAWQAARREGEGRAEALAAWRARLRGLPRLRLPLLPRRGPPSFAGRALRFELPAPLTRALEALAAREGCTLYVALCAAWAATLRRVTRQDDLAIGTVSAGRGLPELRGVVGFFVNTLVLRARPQGDQGFVALLRALREEVAGALALEDLPFDEVVRACDEGPRDTMTPLYQASFTYENVPIPPLEVPDARWRVRLDSLDASVASTAKNELNLTVMRSGDALLCELEVAVDALPLAFAERLTRAMPALLAAAVARPEAALDTLDWVPDAEVEAALAFAPGPPLPAGALPFVERLRALAALDPEATAVEHGALRVGRGELLARADGLAARLIAAGAGPEVRVGVVADRSVEGLVGLVGALLSGAAFVPLDLSWPAERTVDVLDRAGVALVVSPAALASRLPPHGATRIPVGDEAGPPLARAPRPEQLAYVLFTSGSTGQPKGVMVEHRQLAALLAALEAEGHRYGPGAKVLHRASLAFDVSVLETLAPLALGATVVTAPGDAGRTPAALLSIVRRHGVTYADLPPALLALLLDEPGLADARSLRGLTVGGEALDPSLCARALERLPCGLWNNYGPTEATVEVSSWRAEAGDGPPRVTLGRALPGARLYVLDAAGRPCPPGVVGELTIGGPTVARGYLGDPALTRARFVPDPLAGEPGARRYRSGDLARWTEDGELEFLGREDGQVKLRGHRIELGEVEAAARACEGVRDCAAALREDSPGRRQLVAYVVVDRFELTAARLRGLLQARLPAPMVPAVIQFLPALPLTASGKVDRAALPAPTLTREGADEALVPPRDATERTIAGLWEELLDLAPIGVHDDFFALGGHSLQAIRLAAALEQRFGVALSVARVLDQRTVAQQARLVRPEGDDEAAPDGAHSALIPLRQRGDRPPLFCLQPTGATVFCYSELVQHLGADQPVHGLQEGLLDPGSAHLQRIETLAARYIAAARAAQPSGPLHLCGWSFGGVVAFEMARQLHARGEPPATVALLDTAVPGSLEMANPDAPNAHVFLVARFLHMQGVPLDLDDAAGLPAEALTASLGRRVEEAGWFPPGRGAPFVAGLAHNLQAHWQALDRYRPTPYPGELILLRAAERPPRLKGFLGASWDWAPLCAGDYRVFIAPGTHTNMIFNPHAAPLARILRGLMDGHRDPARWGSG